MLVFLLNQNQKVAKLVLRHEYHVSRLNVSGIRITST